MGKQIHTVEQEEWIKEYESKMNKIDFRESLRERYNSLKLEK